MLFPRQSSTHTPTLSHFSRFSVPYTFGTMNVLFLSKKHLLLSPLGGFATLLFLFIFCFLTVHLFLLAKVGWKARRSEAKKPTQEESNKEKNAPTQKPAQEPIYYIVERKRTRTRPKTVYSEPKQIRFK